MTLRWQAILQSTLTVAKCSTSNVHFFTVRSSYIVTNLGLHARLVASFPCFFHSGQVSTHKCTVTFSACFHFWTECYMLRQVDYLIFFSGLFGNADVVLVWKSLPISFVAAYHCRGSHSHQGGSHFCLRSQWPRGESLMPGVIRAPDTIAHKVIISSRDRRGN